ncbi:MAG: cytochrome-c peroxidase [Lewinellaceae bacterium]|nr:cytochrome-c peroxidase [Lewinellaceae bacterium]
MKKFFYLFICVSFLLPSCSDNTVVVEQDLQAPSLPETPYSYSTSNLNFGIKKMTSQFEDINSDVATLGRVLFYDKKLSLNNTISCGTCHHQSQGFADGKQFSQGYEGKLTTRNSLGFSNVALQSNLFWDSRSKTLEDLALKPVQNHIEMGMEDIDNLVQKIEAIDYYKPLFKKAFGNEYVTSAKLSKAIAQFVGSITSTRSRNDIGLSNNFANFSALELMGSQIFHSSRAMCSSCHGSGQMVPLDGPDSPYGGGGVNSQGIQQDLQGATNIGLDVIYKDQGVSEGRFKIPSLRNVALTAPYMHDGRFKTLEEVIDHYSSGIKPNRALDVKFKDANGFPKQLNFSAIEKEALVAFLKTLTDEEMIKDPKWSDPFK